VINTSYNKQEGVERGRRELHCFLGASEVFRQNGESRITVSGHCSLVSLNIVWQPTSPKSLNFWGWYRPGWEYRTSGNLTEMAPRLPSFPTVGFTGVPAGSSVGAGEFATNHPLVLRRRP